MPREKTDITVYAEKDVPETFHEYADWVEKQLAIKMDDRDRQMAFIGSTLRSHYQAAMREIGGPRTQAARNGAAAAPAPARRGKAAAVAEEAPAPARRGRPPKAASAPVRSATKPAATRGRAEPAAAPKRRGRPAAAASGEAPY